MSVRNMSYLFNPKSVALIGASKKPNSVGLTVMHNLLQGGFSGSILPVNPRYDEIEGVKTYSSVSKFPEVPDLAVICTPPKIIPDLIADLGRRGTKVAIVVTAGMDYETKNKGRSLQQEMIDAARPHTLRILGPNCVGLIVPGIGLNASFAHVQAIPGRIAFVTQSGGLVTAVLDWARSNHVGFSHFISLGNSADVDCGDVLDYLASDTKTSAILLYIEAIRHARKFMSAARSAARNKPVIVVKAGRVPEGAKAAASHTGALAGSDDVYDAAIRRAGMLRVYEIEDLFDAAETLARSSPVRGDRLVIVTNGGGPGVLATDELVRKGGRLARLSDDTLRNLNQLLPPTWSGGNPVDIIGDAPVERYTETLKILGRDDGWDAMLFIHALSAIVPCDLIAEGVIPVVKESSRAVLTCWLGVDGAAQARRFSAEQGVPTYGTPEEAVRAFMQMVDYRRNQETLMEVPPSLPIDPTVKTDRVRPIVKGALTADRTMLTEPEAKTILAAYDIPVVETRVVRTAEEAAAVTEELGAPVALKVLSRDIVHKSDVGGVALDLETPQEVVSALHTMSERIRRLRKDAGIDGFTVQRMARKPGAHELIVGIASDPVFGPVVLFGHGGTAVEVIADKAVALPPLNVNLVKELVNRTRIGRLLKGYRNCPPVNLDEVYHTLIQVSRLVADVSEIVELDINPLLADEQGVIALDARMRVAADGKYGNQPHGYPSLSSRVGGNHRVHGPKCAAKTHPARRRAGA